MDDLVIRELKIEDAGDVSRIYGSIVKNNEKIDFKRIFNEQNKGSGMASFVAEVNGGVVGYLISYRLSGGFGIDRSAWIALIGVDPKFMDQGIGKGLAEEAFRFYKEKGINNIYTTVEWDSTDMLQFFKALGFDRSEFVNLRKVIE